MTAIISSFFSGKCEIVNASRGNNYGSNTSVLMENRNAITYTVIIEPSWQLFTIFERYKMAYKKSVIYERPCLVCNGLYIGYTSQIIQRMSQLWIIIETVTILIWEKMLSYEPKYKNWPFLEIYINKKNSKLQVTN